MILLPPSFEESEEQVVFENIENLDASLIGLPLVIYTMGDLEPIPGKTLFRYFCWDMPKGNLEGVKAIEFTALPEDVAMVKLALENSGFTAIASPDIPGLMSGRAIAMIINEASMLAEEGIAQEADIDLAMKLGTNYPLGPFEWMKLWGEARTRQLLQALQQEKPSRYVLAKRFR